MTFHNKQIHIIVFLFVILMCFLIGFKIYQNSNQAQLIQNHKQLRTILYTKWNRNLFTKSKKQFI